MGVCRTAGSAVSGSFRPRCPRRGSLPGRRRGKPAARFAALGDTVICRVWGLRFDFDRFTNDGLKEACRDLGDGEVEYSLVRDFGDVTVYGRRERTDPRHWEMVKNAHATAMIPAEAAASAFMAFGSLHATEGNYPQASFQYRLAVDALGENATAKDHLAASLAYQDSVESAIRLWEEAVKQSDEPAGVWIRAGWALYASGHFEASRNASRRAVQLAPNHPYPQLNIALTYLAEDNIAAADAAYTAVLENHDLPEATASILRALKQKEDLSLEGKALVDRLLSEKPRRQTDHPE